MFPPAHQCLLHFALVDNKFQFATVLFWPFVCSQNVDKGNSASACSAQNSMYSIYRLSGKLPENVHKAIQVTSKGKVFLTEQKVISLIAYAQELRSKRQYHIEILHGSSRPMVASYEAPLPNSSQKLSNNISCLPGKSRLPLTCQCSCPANRIQHVQFYPIKTNFKIN